ncbi:hypothetical protein CC1G_05981 [Coprinopsis cinerea okayama7|uniref:MYND-type domain-containing protein n=1 Tax=Coprinopsis cinerea (strain Okayama-7 / 130 / ATCC MYA-4618 / FGSC 9003) TaxID=240176 RepID=A8N4K3_COPC7|nr:hypothetical protein CC1G_05981 [Coprinopsis cinerea okayama7\|eukprot:XP_001829772.1 hypothetical protein CC1G_05981 [Coprinopsis cinerea okayama7\
MSSGVQLFMKAEQLYAQNRVDETLEYYAKAIQKIVRNENLLAPLPALVPDPTFPKETLGAVWRNFVGFFKDPQMRRTKENSPDAYKLLASYRPNSSHEFERFKSEKEKAYLAGMRITAGLTLGLMHWDAGERPTAVKRYREAIDIASQFPQYNDKTKATTPWERYIANEVQTTRDNLTMLLMNDENVSRVVAEEYGLTGAGDNRKEVLGIGAIRVEGDGRISFVRQVQVASDKCKACGKRDAKLMKCGACKSVNYCGSTCQKADWPAHKAICKSLRA